MTILNSRQRWLIAPAALLMLSLVFAPLGCKRDRRTSGETIEEGPPLATVVHMADTGAGAQLVNGFYGVEQNAWRWTAGRFSVVLRPPRTAAQKGATLQLKLTVPEPVIAKLKAISLSASVNGTPLATETYTQVGQFTYSRDVPASALNGDSVKVDFVLDKSLPPSGADKRELGVVANSVGFEAK